MTSVAKPNPDDEAHGPATELDGRRDPDRFIRDVMPGLVGTLTLRTGDRLVAEDLAQEALARALADWGRVAAMEFPVGWVYRVAFNLANSRWRRLAARRRAEAAGRHDEPVVNLITAEAIVLRDALSRLSGRQREVIVLRFYAGFDVAEVAETLSVSESTVKTQTARALRRLRVELGEPDADR